MSPIVLEKPKRSKQVASSAFVLLDEIADPVAEAKWIHNELNQLRAEQGTKNFGSVFGKWPGEETDAEIDAFLQEVS